MLEFLRKSVKSIFVKAFLGLLILSFAAWGIGDIFRGRAASESLATVGQTEIPIEAFRAEFRRELDRMSQLFGQDITQQQALAMGLGNMLASRLVQSQLINEGARDIGLFVPDTVVVDEIRRTPNFFNDTGLFDRNVYINTLTRSGYTEDRYVAEVRTNMARQQYLSPISQGALAPKGLVDALYAHAKELRSADVVRIAYAGLKNVPAPTQAELAQYHQDNAANFMAPEYRSLTAVVLRADAIAETVTVSEADVQAAYDEREAEYLTPETRKLRQILVQDEAAALNAKSLLDSGRSLDDVAREVGANPAMVDIGDFTSATAANLSADISTAVFALAKGAHTQPLQSPLGWHVIQVSDITPVVVKPLADVRTELTQAVKLDRAYDSLFDLSNRMEDLLGGGMTFEEAARELGIELTVLPAVDAQALTPGGQPALAPHAADIVREGFQLGDGQDSTLVEAEDGTAFFVVRVDGVTPPALRPLDTVMQELTQAWDRDKRAQMAAELANTVKSRLEAGEAANAVAASLDLTAAATQLFTRDGDGLAQISLPANVITDLFALRQGQVISSPGTGAHTVAKLTEIATVLPDPGNPVYAQVAEQTAETMQNDLLAQLSAALEGTYGVSLNRNAMAQALQ